MDLTTLPASLLDDAFRFALLLTGSAAAAERAVIDAIASGAHQLEEMRSVRRRDAMLFSRVREASLRAEPASGEEAPIDAEAAALARKFHEIPEPERSALALFYLDTLEAQEIAEFLGMRLHDLAETLDRGRGRLREAQPA